MSYRRTQPTAAAVPRKPAHKSELRCMEVAFMRLNRRAEARMLHAFAAFILISGFTLACVGLLSILGQVHLR